MLKLTDTTNFNIVRTSTINRNPMDHFSQIYMSLRIYELVQKELFLKVAYIAQIVC